MTKNSQFSQYDLLHMKNNLSIFVYVELIVTNRDLTYYVKVKKYEIRYQLYFIVTAMS